MKKFIFLFLTTLTISAQFPQIVEVEEWTSENPMKWVQMVNDWAKLEANETGYQTFVLQVMEGNKLYLCRGYKSMQELVKNGDERWGEKGWQNRTFEKWNEKYPENAFDGVKPNKVMTHIYSFWPDLSYIPENIDLSKMKYRRHINIDIHQGDNSWNNFVEQTKKAVANDKKLKNNYVRVAYSPMYGGIPNSEFLFIAMDETRAKYFENLEKRTTKRNKDKDWKKCKEIILQALLKKKILCSKIKKLIISPPEWRVFCFTGISSPLSLGRKIQIRNILNILTNYYEQIEKANSNYSI